MDLAEAIYVATRGFPREEAYGLQSQMRRAATSIPANIAEGQGRSHKKENAQFLGIACGSYTELETYIELARRLRYMEPNEVLDELLKRTGQLLYRLRESVSAADKP